MEKNSIIEQLEQAIIFGDVDGAKLYAQQSLELLIDPIATINQGLIKGIRQVGESFGNGEIFLPDLILSSEAMKEASDILEAQLHESGVELRTSVGTLVIGTVAGDIHDIGKTLVATLFKAAGFAVIDLGVDVPQETFIEAVKKYQPDILGLSSLLTTSAEETKRVIKALDASGLRSAVKVLVGGGAITEQLADQIGADAYGGDAREAVEVGKRLLIPCQEGYYGNKECCLSA
ncbi:MAG: corrinoid protein [Pseudomonadota bacterium]